MGKRILLLIAVLLTAACGSGPGDPGADIPQQPEVISLPASGIPDFPSGLESASRSVSDDTVLLQGRDWTEKSDNAEEVGSTLVLDAGETAWGIYSLGGFGQVEPSAVYASFWTDDEMPCRIYLGVADFESGRWRFVDAGKDDFLFEFPEGGRYYSDAGVCYVSVLRAEPGAAKLYSLSFTRAGDTDLEAPAGFSAEASPGLVSLDWLPVDGAVGYNVYRAYDRTFTDQIRLNGDPLPTDSYDDSFLVNGEMYFYRVTAVAAIESAYSESLSVYVPAADLPAPQNLRAIDVGDYHFEIAWDWEGPSPAGGWVVYMSFQADFNLEPPTEKRNIPQGGTRQYRFSNLDPGRLYFVRMAAKDGNGRLGRMTDALPCLTGDQWEWFEVEEIGEGREPVSAVIADGQICASYMKDNVVHVARNGGLGQPWTVESTALDQSITYINKKDGLEYSAGGFASYLDIDYRDGTYLITSVTRQSFDFYAAIGAPEDGWDVELIDKGSGGFLDSPAAGIYCSVAISDNGYNACGVDFYGGGLKRYTRPFGDDQAWNRLDFTVVPEGWPIDVDFEVLDGSLYASLFDYGDRQLIFWSEDDDSFTQVTDNPQGYSYGLQYSDLEFISGAWNLTAYHGFEQDLVLLTDTGEPVWDQYLISDTDDYRTGKGCRMEPFRDGLVCVYMGGGIRDWYCSVLRGNGEWETQLMKIGEIDAYERADLKILNDRPVFVVADRITKKVYAIRGNIPLE